MRLKITTPGKSFEFTAREGATVIIVGTRAQDDVCIDDDSKVSSPHVRLEKSGDVWSFTDQFSDAGTIHNGSKVYSGDLKLGDTLLVGDSRIEIAEIAAAAVAPLANDVVAPASFEMPGNDALAPAAAEPAQPHVFVQRVMNKLVLEFNVQHGFSISGDATAMQRIRQAAEQAVRELESERSTTVNLPFLAADASGPKHLEAHIARKHLHDTGEPRPAPQNTVTQIGAAKPQKNKPFAAVVVAVVMLAFVGGSVWFAMDESMDIEDDVSRMMEESRRQEEEKQRSSDQRKQREEEMSANLNRMFKDTDTPPQQLIDELEVLRQAAVKEEFSIGWEFERTRSELERRVYISVERRYAEVANQMFELQEGRNFRRANELVDELNAWLATSPHNLPAVRMMELDKTIEHWQSSITAGNEELLADQLLPAAEALSREDYAAAAEAVKPLIDGAILSPAQLAALEAEHTDLLAKAARQASGELAAAKPAFDRKRDKLPEAPANTLLKTGDQTARTRGGTIRYNIVEEVREGKWDLRTFSVWGMPARVVGEKTTTQVTLEFTSGSGEHALKFTTRKQFTNYPAAIQLALLEQMGEPEVADYMAMLIYAFDNGLLDDAGRIALAVRNAAPDQRAELDEILAAKWKVPIPEGGFPERDGRVVRE